MSLLSLSAALILTLLWIALGLGGASRPRSWHASFALAILISLNPKLPWSGGDRLRVLIVDRSQSFEPAQREIASAWPRFFRGLRARDRVALIAVGEQARVLGFGSAAELQALGPPPPAIKPGSALSEALTLADELAAAHSGPVEVLLISDGRSTDSAASARARRLRDRGAAVYAWLPTWPKLRGGALTELSGPDPWPTGQAAELFVAWRADAALRGRLRLRFSDKSWSAERRIDAGAPGRFFERFELPAVERGPVRIEAELLLDEGEPDSYPSDNFRRFEASLDSRPELVLIANSRSSSLTALIEALGYDERFWSPSQAELELRARRPPVLLLSKLRDEQLNALAPALQQCLAAGSRIFVGGGAGSFEGQLSSSSTELLPAIIEPPGDEARGLSLFVALDASGSMASRLPGGLRGLQALCGKLGERDELGLLIFSDRVLRAESARPAVEMKSLIASLTSLEGRGGTDLALALRELLAGLKSVSQDRHAAAVLISDAEGQWSEASQAELQEAAAKLRSRNPAARLELHWLGAEPPAAELRASLQKIEAAAEGGLSSSSRPVAAGPEAIAELLSEAVSRAKERLRRGPLGIALTEVGQRRSLPKEGLDAIPWAHRVQAKSGVEVLALCGAPPEPLLLLKDWGAGRVILLAAELELSDPKLIAPLLLDLRPSQSSNWTFRLRREEDRLEVRAQARVAEPEARFELSLEQGTEVLWRGPMIPQSASEQRLEVDAPAEDARLVIRASVASADSRPVAELIAPGAAEAELSNLGPDLPTLQDWTGPSGLSFEIDALPLGLSQGSSERELAPLLALILLMCLLSPAWVRIADWGARLKAEFIEPRRP